jgi:hypothetical protein
VAYVSRRQAFVTLESNTAFQRGYFEPFSDWIQKAFNDGKSKGFELPR